MVINVEYNQLDPLLRAAGHPDGDANCETGYSPFPGNINQVTFLAQNNYFHFQGMSIMMNKQNEAFDVLSDLFILIIA